MPALATIPPSSKALTTSNSPPWWGGAGRSGCACQRRSRPLPSGYPRVHGGGASRASPAPLYEAHAVLAALPQERWQTITWREQDDVVLRKQFVAVRAHWATGGAQCSTSHHRVATGPEGWLLGERPVPGERGEVKG